MEKGKKPNKEIIEKFENKQIQAFQEFQDNFIEWYGKDIQEVSKLNDWRFEFIIKFYAYSEMNYLLANNIITFLEQILSQQKEELKNQD